MLVKRVVYSCSGSRCALTSFPPLGPTADHDPTDKRAQASACPCKSALLVYEQAAAAAAATILELDVLSLLDMDSAEEGKTADPGPMLANSTLLNSTLVTLP